MNMHRIAQFMKVSRGQFAADWPFDLPLPYDELKLPRRGTAGSAGYDFYSPLDFSLAPPRCYASLHSAAPERKIHSSYFAI